MASSPNSTTTNEEEACLYAQQLVTSSILPMTLTSAVNLGIFDIIAKAGPAACLSPSEVAAHLPAQNPQAAAEMLDRIMRLLASYSVLTCSVDEASGERRYGAAPVVKYLAKAGEDGVSMGALGLLIQDKVVMEGWYYLKDAVLGEGLPFHKAHGITIFEYHNIDSRFKNVFNEAMRNHSTIITKNILDAYKGFNDVKVLVDVGGGVGGILNMIVKKYPHVKGINFDLPHIISEAKLIDGVEHVCGDMFESVPSGDAIFMKWILHDWSEEPCLKLLKNCWKALPEKGKVIVMESILPANPEATTAAQAAIAMDLVMLTHSPGGKERTEKEFNSLAKGAGFSGSKVICGYANVWVLEFYK